MAVINKDFRVKNGLVVEGTTATVNGNDILTTTATLGDLSDVSLDTTDNFGDVLTFTTSGWEAQAIPAVNSTDDVSEGSTNLYFTDSRVLGAISNVTINPQNVNASNEVRANVFYAGTSGFSTYLEQDRLRMDDLNLGSDDGSYEVAAFSGTLDVAAYEGNLTLKSSNDVVVDGNLVDTSNVAYAKTTDVNTAVSALVDSAPATLDTLNELAAALGDDPNFATTLTNQIAAKQDELSNGDLFDDTTTNGVRLNSDTSITLAASEGGSIVLEPQGAGVVDVSGNLEVSGTATVAGFLQDSNNVAYAKTTDLAADTDALSEGSSNLYFTDARAVSAIDSSSIAPTNINLASQTLKGFSSGLRFTQSGNEIGRLDSYQVTVFVDPTQIGYLYNAQAAELVVTARDTSSGDVEVTKLLAVIDQNLDMHFTEYGSVASGASLGSVGLGLVEGTMSVTYTPSSNNQLEVTAISTTLA